MYLNRGGSIREWFGLPFIVCILFVFAAICWLKPTVQKEAALNKGPLLAVLCDSEKGRWRFTMIPSAVYVIDWYKGVIIYNVATRSPADDLDAGSDGKIYTAQSGGLGADADNVIGVIDPRRGKLERYIQLQRQPDDVTTAGGRLFVTHGLYFPNTDEITWSEINLHTNKISTFRVPGVAGWPVFYKHRLYFVTYINKTNSLFFKENGLDKPVSVSEAAPKLMPPSQDEIVESLLSLDINSYEVHSVVDREGNFNWEITFDRDGNAYGLISRYLDRPFPRVRNSNDLVVVFRPEERRVVKVVPLPEQPVPAQSMIWHQGKLYVAYYDDDSLAGDTLAVFDAKTFEPIKVLRDFPGPVDLEADADRLFVLCNHNSNDVNGSVEIVDLNNLKVMKSISVGKRPKRIVILPAVKQ